MKQVKVLFVCMGNICRSPTAEGVFIELVERAGLRQNIVIDSAGTHSYHVGSCPDSRAQATAQTRGFDLSALRARKFTAEDFLDFDYVLAMDKDNLRDMQSIMPAGACAECRLFMDFATDHSQVEVPDPYYGGPSGFERVFDMVEDAAAGLLKHIKSRHQLN